MADVGEIDIKLRTSAAESIVERNPLDPGAPTPPANPTRMPEEPNDRDRGAEAERGRVQGIIAACRAARMRRLRVEERDATGDQVVLDVLAAAASSYSSARSSTGSRTTRRTAVS